MRLTLNGVLWLAVVGLTVLLAGLFFQVSESSSQSVDQTTDKLRVGATNRVARAVERYLLNGEELVDKLDKQLRAGACLGSLTESCLLAALLGNPDISEISFTEGKQAGFDEAGLTELELVGRRQVLLYRTGTGEADPVCTQEVTGIRDSFTATTFCRRPHQILAARGEPVRSEALDPTQHDSFRTPARDRFRPVDGQGHTLWTDLSWSQVDEERDGSDRRVVVTALRSVEGDDQKLLGVIKVSLLHQKVAQIVTTEKVNPEAPKDPYVIFIADDQGRLITPLDPADVIKEDGDDLRISSQKTNDIVGAALARPSLVAATEKDPQKDDFLLGGAKYFINYVVLKNTQGWRLGIVGPESFYNKSLVAAQKAMIYWTLAGLAILLVGGVLALRIIRNVFGQIERETTRMSSFDFAKHEVKSAFADVRETLYSLEKAKTAVRAMGRYVPLPLVRGLFEANAEPMLGGTLREVTIFFSDIEGFTTRAEAEPPDVVAKWLGLYLEVMTNAVQAEDGTVDKFIGDSVMALWNAPKANPDHAVRACRAALRCQRETQKLYQSPQWAGRAPLVTRIGLHVDAVMVGHFGAPDRLSYTAIGDGVNLASRLEGLNKQYGTTMLVSEEVFKLTRHEFAFRRLDLVAVKGKSQAIGVYELLGELAQPSVPTEVVKRYEEGLASYCAGDFARARGVLAQNKDDSPSQVLGERCAELEKNPPAQPWAGYSVAHSK